MHHGTAESVRCIRRSSGLSFQAAVGFLILLAAGDVAFAAPCQPTCFDKRWSLPAAGDANSNGLVDAGDTVRFEVTLCQRGNSAICTVTDALDGLNQPADLTLVPDPAVGSGPLATCTANDDGQTTCVAEAGGATQTTCTGDAATDTVTATFDMARDGCFTAVYFAQVDAAFAGLALCNQARQTLNQLGISDYPSTPLIGDATCFPLGQPRPQPAVDKSVRICPAPCVVPVQAAPGLTTVTYEIVLGPNEHPTLPQTINLTDDVPAGAVAFRVTDRGDGQDCTPPGPPTCNNQAPPAGANGTGLIAIDGIVLDPKGGAAASRTVRFEADFSCPPTTSNEVVSNQATVYTAADAATCNPCSSDDPATAAPLDATDFTAVCVNGASIEVTKNRLLPGPGDPASWRPGDSLAFDYRAVITNPAAALGALTAPQLRDLLPVDAAGAPVFDQTATCPVVVVPTPAQLNMLVNNAACGAALDPFFDVTGLDPLNPGQQVALDYTVTIPANLADGTAVCNLAVASAVDAGGATVLNVAQACTTIHRPVMSTSTKQVSPNPVPPGAAVTWTITIANTGSIEATAVALSDDFAAAPCLNLSTGVVDSCQRCLGVNCTPCLPGDNVSYDNLTGLLSGTFALLASGESIEVKLTVDTQVGASGACCNSALVSWSDQALSPATLGPTCTQIKPTPVLDSSTKLPTPAAITAGDPVLWTLSFTNTGDIPASNVQVDDDLGATTDGGGGPNACFDRASGLVTSCQRCMGANCLPCDPADVVTYDANVASPGFGHLVATFPSLAVGESAVVTLSIASLSASAGLCCNSAATLWTERDIALGPLYVGAPPDACVTIGTVSPGLSLLRNDVTTQLSPLAPLPLAQIFTGLPAGCTGDASVSLRPMTDAPACASTPGEGVAPGDPGSPDGEDYYVAALPVPPYVDPDYSMLGDAARPLVFYQVHNLPAASTVKLVKQLPNLTAVVYY